MGKIIFVGGSPRSGTSLLQRILNSNSNIHGGPEFNRFIKIIELRNSFKVGIENKLLESYFSDLNHIDLCINEFVSKIFSEVLSTNNKSVLSEKTPNNILVFNELMEVFPNAKFLFVIRNPFAIVNSMKQVKSKAVQNKKNIPDFVSSINKSINKINLFWKSGFGVIEKDPKKICLVEYENLITNPESEIRRISNFLEIDFEQQMLNPNKQKFDYKIKEDTIWASNEVRNQEITSDNIDKWKNNLSQFEKYYISKKIIHHPLVYNSYNLEVNCSIFVKLRYQLTCFKEMFIEAMTKSILAHLKTSSLRKYI